MMIEENVRRMIVTGGLVGLLFALGCGKELPEVDCTMVTPQTYSQLAIISVCTGCHSSQLSGASRNGAPGDVDYDTFAEAKAGAEEGAAEVFGGDMPPGGGVNEADKQAFYEWALCGTPQ